MIQLGFIFTSGCGKKNSSSAPHAMLRAHDVSSQIYVRGCTAHPHHRLNNMRPSTPRQRFMRYKKVGGTSALLGSPRGQKAKTYNRRDSQMVTHSSTSRPVQCLCMAERTGCPVFTDLWSYVLDLSLTNIIELSFKKPFRRCVNNGTYPQHPPLPYP